MKETHGCETLRWLIEEMIDDALFCGWGPNSRQDEEEVLFVIDFAELKRKKRF